MIASRLVANCSIAGLLVACGPGSASVVASADVSAQGKAARAGEPRAEGAASSGSGSGDGRGNRAGGAAAPAEEPAPLPRHDPELVRDAVDKTSSPPDDRERLGVRLAVVEQGPESPWLVAVANRGSEPVRVLFDLRTLSLEVTPPLPDPPADGKPVPRKKVVKPVVCALPKEALPAKADARFELSLEPGEAVIDAFDPRLYCPPTEAAALVPGATVTPRLGFTEKTKTVWKKGKREQKLLEQTAPFVAELVEHEEPPPPPEQKGQKKTEPAEGEPLAFEKFAVKMLVGQTVTLGEAYAAKPKDAERSPLSLVLARGSDASTEREATITVSLLNRSPRPQTVYFRRELVSLEVSGPTGLVECDPGPDARAPERLGFSTIKPGGRLSATSRLIELCPAGALRVPGLYLVHGRFESRAGGQEFGLDAFRGRIVSDKPALVRVRKGWGDLPAQREPLRVHIGGVPSGEGS